MASAVFHSFKFLFIGSLAFNFHKQCFIARGSFNINTSTSQTVNDERNLKISFLKLKTITFKIKYQIFGISAKFT